MTTSDSHDMTDGRPTTNGDPLLARLLLAHGERQAVMPATVVRVLDAAGRLQFAAVIDNEAGLVKVKLMANGREFWLPRSDIVEAA